MPKKLLPRSFFISDQAYDSYIKRALGPGADYFMADLATPWFLREGASSSLQAEVYSGSPYRALINAHIKSNPYLYTGRGSRQRKYSRLGENVGFPRDMDALTRRASLEIFGNSIDYNTSVLGAGSPDLFSRKIRERMVDLRTTQMQAHNKLVDIEFGPRTLPSVQGARPRSVSTYSPFLKDTWLTDFMNRRGRSEPAVGRAYGIKPLPSDMLGVASNMEDAWQGFTAGSGKPSYEMARRGLDDTIEAIASGMGSEAEKTEKINRLLARTHSSYFSRTSDEASGAFNIGSFGIPGVKERWWGKYDASRVPFYKDISLSSYRPTVDTPGFLASLDIDLASRTDLRTGEPISLSDIPSRIATSEKKWYLSGEKVIGFTKFPIESDSLYMGKPTAAGSRLYMSQTAQRSLATHQFGQSKVLRDTTTGKLVPLGTRVISKDIIQSSRVTKREYLDSIRSLYAESVRKGKIVDIEKYRLMIMDATVDIRAFNPAVKSAEIKVHQDMRSIKDTIKYNDNINNSISVARGHKKVTFRGYEEVRDIVEGSQAGEEFFIREGNRTRKGMVEELTSIQDVSLLMRSNKVLTYGEHFSKTMNLDQKFATMPDLFEAAVVRKPFTKGSKVHPYTLRLYGGTGTYLGNLSREIEGTIGVEAGQEVLGGYAGKVFIRPYISKWEKKKIEGKQKLIPTYQLGIWKSAEESYEALTQGKYPSPLSFDKLSPANIVQGHWNFQNEIKSMMRMEREEWVSPNLEKIISSKFPRVSLEGLGQVEAAAWRAGTAAPVVSTKIPGKPGRALIATSVVTAGALLLWGASRIRSNAPLTERDVHESPYGRSPQVPMGTGIAHIPNTRIVPQNTGYVTNIDIETKDNGAVSHSDMATSMSSIARTALRSTKNTTTLHVIDDSTSMDKESVRRKLNQQLRR